MLAKLFGSKARVKILKLFLSRPEKKYYIRQISRDLGLQLNSVRRELENLEKFGLLAAKTGTEEQGESEEDVVLTENRHSTVKTKVKKDQPSRAEKKFYQANIEFVLYEEIKNLIMKAQILYEKDFINKLAKIGNIQLLILTGFFVNMPEIPVDLLVVGKINKNNFKKLISELEGDLGREVNFTLFSKNEFIYRRDITDVFLYGILEGKKLIIVNKLGIS